MNYPYYPYPRGTRFVPGGVLLPFLAGIAVTTPFIFLAKNQQPSVAYAGPMPGYQGGYPPYSMNYPPAYYYPYQGYMSPPYFAYVQRKS